MASQPITTARRRPMHWLGFDQGVLLVAVALISHWSGQTLPAIACGAVGILAMGHAAFRTFRRTTASDKVAATAVDGAPAKRR